MILYFTGTGNSKFVADFLADKLNDKTLSLNSVLKNNQKLVCNSDNPFVITAPIYAWRLPHKIEELIKNAEFTGNKNVYFVVTMGENSGNADKYIEKILTEKGLNLAGYIGVSMQNNYLVMEKMPDITVVNQHIENIFPKLEYIADSIRNNKILKKDDKTPLSAFMSGFVNYGFNNFMLKNQKYSTDEKCILCAKCIEVCPVNNISIKGGEITFGNNCMACFACLHSCPLQSINIKGKTEDKGRYLCPEYKNFK